MTRQKDRSTMFISYYKTVLKSS